MDSKRIAGAVLTFVALALAGDWIVRGGNVILGYLYHDDALDWLAVRTAAGMLALPIGLYFLLRPTSKSGRALALERVTTAIDNVRFEIGAFTGDARRGIYTELASLYLNLEKLGIQTPSLAKVADREEAYRQGDNFLLSIRPLLRDGHLSEVRRNAPHAIAAIGATPSTMRKWWQPARLNHTSSE